MRLISIAPSSFPRADFFRSRVVFRVVVVLTAFGNAILVSGNMASC